MVERYNKNANPLKLSVGEYVCMLTEQTGQGRKFQPKYTGPLVVHKIVSDHIVKLRNPSTGKLFRNDVHLDRLKIATAAWGMDFVSSSPLFSTTPPPLFSKFSYKSFLFQNFHNHSFFLHLTISVDVIHHE